MYLMIFPLSLCLLLLFTVQSSSKTDKRKRNREELSALLDDINDKVDNISSTWERNRNPHAHPSATSASAFYQSAYMKKAEWDKMKVKFEALLGDQLPSLFRIALISGILFPLLHQAGHHLILSLLFSILIDNEVYNHLISITELARLLRSTWEPIFTGIGVQFTVIFSHGIDTTQYDLLILLTSPNVFFSKYTNELLKLDLTNRLLVLSYSHPPPCYKNTYQPFPYFGKGGNHDAAYFMAESDILVTVLNKPMFYSTWHHGFDGNPRFKDLLYRMQVFEHCIDATYISNHLHEAIDNNSGNDSHILATDMMIYVSHQLSYVWLSIFANTAYNLYWTS